MIRRLLKSHFRVKKSINLSSVYWQPCPATHNPVIRQLVVGILSIQEVRNHFPSTKQLKFKDLFDLALQVVQNEEYLNEEKLVSLSTRTRRAVLYTDNTAVVPMKSIVPNQEVAIGHFFASLLTLGLLFNTVPPIVGRNRRMQQRKWDLLTNENKILKQKLKNVEIKDRAIEPSVNSLYKDEISEYNWAKACGITSFLE